ncbi:MAG: SUMF1/EgtB/PvdO family nonheme iron enzyme [Pirellulales bacterium]|nr:SUMF1/EgtB/PvdO family nonheme iron enzyme [Pirellulales bacterium]
MSLDFHSKCIAFMALTLFVAAAARADVFNMPAGFTSLQFVAVGNPGNAADTAVMNDATTGYGSVGYAYNIGMYDVTAAQYSVFLNAVANTADPYGLYNANMNVAANAYGCNIVRGGAAGSYSYSVAAEWANRPVNYVSWGDAARFCNWLQNGQPSGAQTAATTEDGAYYLNGANSDAALSAVARKTAAAFFLPNENEWYKAAYYDPNKPGGTGYWTYATKNDSPPSNVLSPTGTNNANYMSGNYGPYYRNEVGAFAGSPGPYGTFDQNGNVNQWIETKFAGSTRGLRGGGYGNAANVLASAFRNYTVPTGDAPGTGFRVAGILETAVYTWKGGSDDTMTAWGVAANWTPIAAVPDGPGVNVCFGAQPATSPIVDMVSVGRTVANIIFVDATSTLVQSTYGHSLTLNNRGSLSTIDVTGEHFISAPVIISNNAKISGAGTLNLWGGISGNYTLTVTGKLNAASIRVDKLVVSAPAAQSVPESTTLAMLGIGICGTLTYFCKRIFAA